MKNNCLEALVGILKLWQITLYSIKITILDMKNIKIKLTNSKLIIKLRGWKMRMRVRNDSHNRSH